LEGVIEPGSKEAFKQILAGKTNLGVLKLLEIHGGVHVFTGPIREETRSVLIGETTMEYVRSRPK
jgi:hypothetical protein